jgi:hypothetical protein
MMKLMRTGILLLATLLASSINPLRGQTPDTDPPTVVDIIPAPGSTNRTLNNVEVLFNEPVTNVQASDLLINGAPATQISFGIPGQFIFNFATPATGVVQVAWAPGHGITDLASPPNPFAGGNWTYVLDPNLAVGTVIINEFLASNSGDTYRDEDGDASDWIELYNFGSSLVDLSGWFLTDDASKF